MLKRILKTIILCLIFLKTSPNQAQDLHFSQFYANPLYLNPALAGTHYENRVIMNYRVQWPQLSGEFVSYNFSWDLNSPTSRSNLGILTTLDRAGSAGISSTNFGLLYAYTIPLNEEIAINAGLQASYNNKSLDYFKLVFGDQLEPTGYTGSPSAEQGLENLGINYIDFSSGFVLYSSDFWFGFAAHHLNQPNQAIAGGDVPVPIKFSIHTGYRWVFYENSSAERKLEHYASIQPMLFYARQGDFQQLDLAINAFYDPLTLGISYRGVPIANSITSAIATTVGFKYKYMNFLYTYDYVLKGLNSVTGGAHEISLMLNIYDKKRKKRSKRDKIVHFPSLVD